MNRVYNKQFNFSCTSTASDRMKNAINTKNSPFTKPASTSALPYLFIRIKLKVLLSTVELQLNKLQVNEPLFNKVLGISNSILCPNNGKICRRELRYYKTSL